MKKCNKNLRRSFVQEEISLDTRIGTAIMKIVENLNTVEREILNKNVNTTQNVITSSDKIEILTIVGQLLLVDAIVGETIVLQTRFFEVAATRFDPEYESVIKITLLFV